jgi:hypothetical protein
VVVCVSMGESLSADQTEYKVHWAFSRSQPNLPTKEARSDDESVESSPSSCDLHRLGTSSPCHYGPPKAAKDHVIQVVMGSFQPDTEALDTLRWLDETFELVSWIEERSTRLLGKVIVDNLVYSSEGEGAITIQRFFPPSTNHNLQSAQLRI